MAGFINGVSATFISAADYSATPYRIVHVTAADTVTRSTDADGAGQFPLGVLTDEVGAASVMLSQSSSPASPRLKPGTLSLLVLRSRPTLLAEALPRPPPGTFVLGLRSRPLAVLGRSSLSLSPLSSSLRSLNNA